MLQSALQPTSLSGIVAYIARNVSDIVILKCLSRAETNNSLSRKDLPVDTEVIARNYYIVAMNSKRKYIYGMRKIYSSLRKFLERW
jgi:hypothetical protein